MRVEDRIRKSVLFIGIDGPHGFVPWGTGALCMTTIGESAFQWVVTAAHVFNSLGDRQEFSIRVNRNSGGAQTVKIDARSIIGYESAALDVCIFPVSLDQAVYDITHTPLDRSMHTKERENIWSPGPGDEVCVVGVYTSHYGLEKNIPIVRIGHVAAMPEEPVSTSRGYVEGYIVEVHSIAGLSGSPVWVNVPTVRMRGDNLQATNIRIYHLLGILVGHHASESHIDRDPVPQFQIRENLTSQRHVEASAGEGEIPNTGFGVVIPIEAIFGLVESEFVVGVQERALKRIREP